MQIKVESGRSQLGRIMGSKQEMRVFDVDTMHFPCQHAIERQPLLAIASQKHFWFSREVSIPYVSFPRHLFEWSSHESFCSHCHVWRCEGSPVPHGHTVGVDSHGLMGSNARVDLMGVDVDS